MSDNVNVNNPISGASKYVIIAIAFALIVIIAMTLIGIASDARDEQSETQKTERTDINNPITTDTAAITRALEEMTLQFQNKEMKPKFYPEGNNFQFVPISNIPSQIIVRNLLITDLRVEGDYLVGYVGNLQNDQLNNNERMSFRYIGKDGNRLIETGRLQMLISANEVEAEHFSTDTTQFSLAEGVNKKFRTQVPKQAIIVLIQ